MLFRPHACSGRIRYFLLLHDHIRYYTLKPAWARSLINEGGDDEAAGPVLRERTGRDDAENGEGTEYSSRHEPEEARFIDLLFAAVARTGKTGARNFKTS